MKPEHRSIISFIILYIIMTLAISFMVFVSINLIQDISNRVCPNGISYCLGELAKDASESFKSGYEKE